jgi:(p)ppGpp synthase/HD superfamily hydrolase
MESALVRKIKLCITLPATVNVNAMPTVVPIPLELQLSNAITIAAICHNKDVDKGGKPYILHPLRIMYRLRTDDLELMAMAALHDVLEDSELTVEDFRAFGFSERIIEGCDRLTHKEGMDYEQYIDVIGQSPDSTAVKIEDLRDNSDIMRMKGVRQKDFDRLAKYHRSFQYLRDLDHSFKGPVA